MAPKDLHFVRAPSNFLAHGASAGDAGSSGDGNILRAARLRGRTVVLEEVKRFMRRSPLTSPTDFTNKIKVGELCLKKRTSFPTHSPKKLSYKLVVDAFKVVDKVATNNFRVKSIISGDVIILPGDQLVKVVALDEEELRGLCREMETTVRRSSVTPSSLAGAPDDGLGGRIRRSRRIADRAPAVTSVASWLFR